MITRLRQLAPRAQATITTTITILACALQLVLGPRSALAQAPTKDVQLRAERFGLTGGLAAERWNPWRLFVDSGAEAWSGIITVSYRQDTSQQARIVVPAATTPGVVVPIEVPICPPHHVGSIALEFSDGRTTKTFTYSNEPGDRPLPETFSYTPQIVGFGVPPRVLGFLDPKPDSPASAQAQPGAGGVPQFGARFGQNSSNAVTAGPWPFVRASARDALDMPLSWGLYDCADVVIVPDTLGLGGGSQVAPQAWSALMDWVRAGGKLVVLVTTPEGVGRFTGGRVPSAAPGMHPLPKSLADDLKTVGISTSDTTAERLRGHAFTLSEQDQRAGWSLRYTLPQAEPADAGTTADADAGTDPPAPSSAGLIAQGPVGFGVVTLVGFDPASLGAKLSADLESAAWRATLKPLIRNYQAENPGWGGHGFVASGVDGDERSAIGSILQSVSDVPEIGSGVFIGIAAAVFALALLVGPIDALVLRRLSARQHSWATALLWIVLASVAGYVIPRSIRSGDDRIMRFAAVDIIPAQPGPGLRAQLGPGFDPPLACRVGITGVFLDNATRSTLIDEADGALVRGISPSFAYGDSEGTVSTTLESAFGTRGPNQRPGVALLPQSLRQWTYRAFMDQAPTDARWEQVSASLVPEQARLLARIEGLPDGFEVASASLRIATNPKNSAASPPGLHYVGLNIDTKPGRIEIDFPIPAADDPNGLNVAQSGTHDLALSPSRRRDPAIGAYVASGAWACLVISAEGVEPDLRPQDAPRWVRNSKVLLRVMIPLDPDLTLAPTTPKSSEKPE